MAFLYLHLKRYIFNVQNFTFAPNRDAVALVCDPTSPASTEAVYKRQPCM